MLLLLGDHVADSLSLLSTPGTPPADQARRPSIGPFGAGGRRRLILGKPGLGLAPPGRATGLTLLGRRGRRGGGTGEMGGEAGECGRFLERCLGAWVWGSALGLAALEPLAGAFRAPRRAPKTAANMAWKGLEPF